MVAGLRSAYCRGTNSPVLALRYWVVFFWLNFVTSWLSWTSVKSPTAPCLDTYSNRQVKPEWSNPSQCLANVQACAYTSASSEDQQCRGRIIGRLGDF